MSLKTKLVSTISAICMVLALLTVGVWAVSTASVTLGGSVSFTADNVHARITGSVTGTQETISLAELNYSADLAPTTELDSWANNQMTFTSENLITMTITVENLSEERSVFVTLTDNTTTDNVGKTLKQGASNYTSGSAVEVTAGNTTTFTMTLSVTDKNQSASATVSYQVDLRDANAEAETPEEPETPVEPIELLHDTTNDYYYVEMGTYYEAPIRWRVVGVDGEHYEYNENQAPTGELAFILETTIAKDISFGHVGNDESLGMEIGNNDYATSMLRQYITGHDCALTCGGEDLEVNKNFLDDIGIDASNLIYKQIKARDIEELYNNINWDGQNTISDGNTTATGLDKLWIPSVAEIYSIVGGGDISTITDASEWSEYYANLMFGPDEYMQSGSAYYWLRTPNEDNSMQAYYVDYSGFCMPVELTMPYVDVRPMFLLNV